MAISTSSRIGETLPELKAFINENSDRVVAFCEYMLPPDFPCDDLVLDIFRSFGQVYRDLVQKQETRQPLEVRVHLFRLAWERIRENLPTASVYVSLGRDTRNLKGLDDDLLVAWEKARVSANAIGKMKDDVVERIRAVDAEFRVGVILRDLLGFEDEEVAQILKLRWGVYRHRLHRGRIEFTSILRGRTQPGMVKDGR